MRVVLILSTVGMIAACAAPASKSNHQNLDVAECRALAEETFRSGKLNYDLCPGYAPDGQKIEIF